MHAAAQTFPSGLSGRSLGKLSRVRVQYTGPRVRVTLQSVYQSQQLDSDRNFFSSRGLHAFRDGSKENKGMIVVFMKGKGNPFHA